MKHVPVAPHEELYRPILKRQGRSKGFGSVHLCAFPRGVILRIGLVNADIRNLDRSLFQRGRNVHRRHVSASFGYARPCVGMVGIVTGIKVEHGAGNYIGEYYYA